MKILEIPPYRKNQINQNPTAIVNPSPPRGSDIPPFRAKKLSNDWHPAPIDNTELQPVQIPAALNSDLIRKLKNSEGTVHRSTDCIVAGGGGSRSEHGNTNESAATMKVAPSWTNVAQRSESISSTTGTVAASQSGGSKKSSIDDETKGIKFGIIFQFSTKRIFIHTVNLNFPIIFTQTAFALKIIFDKIFRRL